MKSLIYASRLLTAGLRQRLPDAGRGLRDWSRGQQGGCMAALLLVTLLLTSPPASAQVQPLQWQCGTVGTQVCPANTTYPLPVTGAITGGGASIFSSTSLTSTKVAVKTTGGTVSFIQLANTGNSAALCYLQVFDATAANVTVGTTTPTLVLAVAAATVLTAPLNVPLQFSNAITVAATTTATGLTACNPILQSTLIAYK